LNTISFNNKVVSDNTWKVLADFREEDHAKIDNILKNMFGNIKKLLPNNFKYEIIKEESNSNYLADAGTYYDEYKIKMKADDHEQELSFLYPKLVQKNYFILNGSFYVPLIFLERSPIDILRNEKRGENIFVNLLPTFNLTFNFAKNTLVFRKKEAMLNAFMKALYGEESDRYKKLVNDNIIEETDLNEHDSKIHVLKMMGIHNTEFFENSDMTLSKFFDDYLFLDYFKDMFTDFFDVNDIKGVVDQVIKYHTEQTEIDMASLKNRRIVCNEYLITAIYEMYLRLLFSSVEKKENQSFLPTMNKRVILTTGFRGLMHGGNFFNIGLPYTSPILNKISQDIYIISDSRIPKSWTSNHPSALGRICPISVSAQNMGSNIVGTNNMLVNHYGRVK